MNQKCREHQNKTDPILSHLRCGYCIDQEITALEEKLQVAREALKYYSDPPGMPSVQLARLALAKLDDKGVV